MVRKLFTAQLVVVTVCSLFLTFFADRLAGFSAITGGGIALLSTLYFASRFFRVNPHETKRVLKTFYLSEAGKWVVTALLFFLVIRFLKVDMGFVFIGYIAAQSAFWWVPLMDRTGGTKVA